MERTGPKVLQTHTPCGSPTLAWHRAREVWHLSTWQGLSVAVSTRFSTVTGSGRRRRSPSQLTHEARFDTKGWQVAILHADALRLGP